MLSLDETKRQKNSELSMMRPVSQTKSPWMIVYTPGQHFRRISWTSHLLCHTRVSLCTRVVFGVSSNPFLLNATVKHHAERYAEKDPAFVEAFLG